MINRHWQRIILGPAAIMLGLALNSASADVVARSTYGAGPNPSVPGAGPSFANFDISLDLGGYSGAAVSFNFSALISRNPARFTVNEAHPSDFVNDFQLVLPAPTSDAPMGFRRIGSGTTFSTAMFNLAKYDGQTVLLSFGFDGPADNRGLINIENLLITVQATGASPSATSIPEPSSLALFLGALLALRLVRLRRPLRTLTQGTG